MGFADTGEGVPEDRRWDVVTRAWVDLPRLNPRKPILMLEVGAGFGSVSIAAAKNNGRVIVNDLDTSQLKQMAKDLTPDLRARLISFQGDITERQKFGGLFIDAILIRRVVHFFSPVKFMKALRECYRLLKRRGQLYIVVATPFLKGFLPFHPVYERRVAERNPWPGFIDGETHKVSQYYPEGAGKYPEMLNLLDRETLARALRDAGFRVPEEPLWMRDGSAPESLALDGRELVGAVAFKP